MKLEGSGVRREGEGPDACPFTGASTPLAGLIKWSIKSSLIETMKGWGED
jgi:hypothetical protein